MCCGCRNPPDRRGGRRGVRARPRLATPPPPNRKNVRVRVVRAIRIARQARPRRPRNGDGEITADAGRRRAAARRIRTRARATRVANLNPARRLREIPRDPGRGERARKSGEPVVVTDGGRDWTIGMEWGFDGLAKRYGPRVTWVCNDRAPARRADSREKKKPPSSNLRRRARTAAVLGSWGGPQRSCALPLEDYFAIRGARRPGGATTSPPRSPPPTRRSTPTAGARLKGRRSRRRPTTPRRSTRSPTTPRLATAFPLPYFTSEIDHTRADSRSRTYKKLLPSASDDARVRRSWTSLDASLDEVIRGSVRDPITRLHQDAGGRARVARSGCRVASCSCVFPPDDAAAFVFRSTARWRPLQSAIDPLAPPEALRKQRRAYFEDARPVVFVVHPGEGRPLCPKRVVALRRRARSQRDRDAELLQRQHERERARGDDHRQGAGRPPSCAGEEAAAAGARRDRRRHHL